MLNITLSLYIIFGYWLIYYCKKKLLCLNNFSNLEDHSLSASITLLCLIKSKLKIIFYQANKYRFTEFFLFEPKWIYHVIFLNIFFSLYFSLIIYLWSFSFYIFWATFSDKNITFWFKFKLETLGSLTSFEIIEKQKI